MRCGGGLDFWGLSLGEEAAEEVGAGVVVGDEVLELEDQAVGVTGLSELAEEFEAGGDVLGEESVSGEDADLFVVRGEGVLQDVAQLFVELFAGADSGEFDFDVLVGTEPGEQNEVSGQVHDLDGLAHVEHEDLAAAGHGRSLKDELAGFRDGHEEAAPLRVDDGEGSAGGELPLEDGDDAAAGAEDVSEADGDELGSELVACGLWWSWRERMRRPNAAR